MASRLANKIIFTGCVNPEGEEVAADLSQRVKESQILLNADEPVRRFFELDTDGPHKWHTGSELPNVAPPSGMLTVFIECRAPEKMPEQWARLMRQVGVDCWGVSFSYQDLIGHFSANSEEPDPRRAAHKHAREVLAKHLAGRGGPQGQPSGSLADHDGSTPASKWLLESELFLHRAQEKCVLGGAYGMDAVIDEKGRFAALKNGERAVYYRGTPKVFDADLGPDTVQMATAMAIGAAALYIPLLTTLCMTHHDSAPPLSYLPGVTPSSEKSSKGISSANNWRTFDSSAVEQALEDEAHLYHEGLKSALCGCAHRFRS